MSPSLRLVLPILVAAGSLGLLASSIYVPSIPDIARDLGVSVGLVQLTMTVFLVAYGSSMLIVGALSDRFGRRKVLLTGILLCLIASLGCALARSIEVLLIGRAFQALGSCAGVVIARAMVRDLFDREQTARAMSILAASVTIVPVMAPALGGYLQVWLGWRASFFVVAIGAALLYGIVSTWLPETNVTLQNQASLFRGLSNSFLSLARSRRFLGYAMVTGCGGAAYYAFASAAPIVFIERLHVSPDIYGLYAGVSSLGFFFGSAFSGRYSMRTGTDFFIRLGGLIQLAAGAALIGFAWYGVEATWAIAVPLFFMGSANGMYMPNAFAGGVSVHPHLAGAAAGLAGFVQMAGAGLSTIGMASIEQTSAIPMGVVIAGAGIIITLAFRGMEKEL